MGEYGDKGMRIAADVKKAARATIEFALKLGVRRMQDELNFLEDDARKHIRICLIQLVEEI